MPESCEVLHGLANAILVVDRNVADARKLRSHVNKHKRNLAVVQIFDERIFHPEGKDSYAIYASLNHAAHREFHSLGVVDRGGQKDFIIMLDGEVFERLDYFGEKGIGDFRNDQPKDATTAGNQ